MPRLSHVRSSSADGKDGGSRLDDTAIDECDSTLPKARAETVAAAPHPPTDPAAGSVHVGELLGGRYQLLNEIGKGAEGVVYRALDVTADVLVALKILQHRGPQVMGRLRRELKVARRVTHPNVVRLYDLIQLPGLVGLSMELVEGESLERRLRRAGPLAGAELLSLAYDLARGLAAAHAAGVTHRDLKPANVILRLDGRGATITDFGIARLHDAARESAARGYDAPTSVRLTRRGALVGTPIYMAPEQLQGRTDIGPATDVHAFGLVVREAATPGSFAWRARSARLPSSAAPGMRPPILRVTEPKRITFGECDEFPSFTRDGTRVVYDTTEGANSNVRVIDLRDGSTRQLTHPDGWDYAATRRHQSRDGALRTLASGRHFWELFLPSPDGRYAVLSESKLDTIDLVAFALDGSETIPLGDVPVHATTADVSVDRRRLVWSTCSPRYSVARLADNGPVAALPQIGEWTISHLTAISGSERIIVVSARSGENNPWVLDRSGSEPPRLVEAPGLGPVAATASQDGWLALQTARNGIAVMPLDQGLAPRMLTTDASDATPRFRRGGREVVFSRRTPDGSYQVYWVPRTGGTPLPFIDPGSRSATPFPADDRVVYLSGNSVLNLVPEVFDPASGTSRPLSAELGPGEWQPPVVSEDGRRVAIILGDRELAEVDVASGQVLRRVKAGDALSGGAYVGGELYFVHHVYKGSLLIADVTWQ